jgi:hypothetical protein
MKMINSLSITLTLSATLWFLLVPSTAHAVWCCGSVDDVLEGPQIRPTGATTVAGDAPPNLNPNIDFFVGADGIAYPSIGSTNRIDPHQTAINLAWRISIDLAGDAIFQMIQTSFNHLQNTWMLEDVSHVNRRLYQIHRDLAQQNRGLFNQIRNFPRSETIEEYRRVIRGGGLAVPGHVALNEGFIRQGYGRAQSLTSTLYHYTTAAGREGIETNYMLNPTTTGGFGVGQYFTDIIPENFNRAVMDRIMPRRYETVDRMGDPSYYYQIRVTGLPLNQATQSDIMAGDGVIFRPHNRLPNIFIYTNDTPLDISGRIIRRGEIDYD